MSALPEKDHDTDHLPDYPESSIARSRRETPEDIARARLPLL
jgi:hypothetical protein